MTASCSIGWEYSRCEGGNRRDAASVRVRTRAIGFFSNVNRPRSVSLMRQTLPTMFRISPFAPCS